MNNRYKGIICIVGAAFCFAVMNLFVNLSGDLPVYQKGLFRNLVAIVFASVILYKNRKKDGMKINKSNFPLLFIRAFAGTIGFLCNFYAVGKMNISDASMLNKLAPFFSIILSFFFLKEKARLYQWIAVVIAFLGSLLIVKPSFQYDFLPGVIGVAGGLCAGIAYTCVRKLGQTGTKSPLIVFTFSAFSCIILGPVTIFNYVPMTKMQLFELLMAGLAASGGQFFVTAAYSFAPAKEISVYDYSQVIFAALLGLIFLNQKPDILSIIGYFVICSVAIAMFLYTRHLEKKNLYPENPSQS